MKCPKCKTEGFGLTEYNQKNMKVKPYTAVMQCAKCGHKEVFG